MKNCQVCMSSTVHRPHYVGKRGFFFFSEIRDPHGAARRWFPHTDGACLQADLCVLLPPCTCVRAHAKVDDESACKPPDIVGPNRARPLISWNNSNITRLPSMIQETNRTNARGSRASPRTSPLPADHLRVGVEGRGSPINASPPLPLPLPLLCDDTVGDDRRVDRAHHCGCWLRRWGDRI